ncbi:methionine gamma-lyase [Pelotomaculum schinkii]|uniref:Methionine gamma-lyase n=1 Tax=Pelotomaculum schinkii TaxID=78350 RepID=A0A4Y7RDN4_9FIRM|nr:methionine gamma-lyase family protein [Pelotomaculum schinkii]TEB06850.1 methionine gamma-lyase [Pelotomaculum schinkii]
MRLVNKLYDLELLSDEVEEEVQVFYRQIDKIALANHGKVLDAFRAARVSEYHLKGSTGYGYGDAGREALEEVYARVFHAEKALVRNQIVSGTHAIALCLYGVLRPGDELLAVQGQPYDTLGAIIGIRDNASGSLKDLMVSYKQVEPTPEGDIDYDRVGQALGDKTKMVLLQRSCGYGAGKPLSIKELKGIIEYIRQRNPETVIFVDNCYGEFVEEEEPLDAGADLAAGSLIKNPGGGVAPTGGYVVGREKYVNMAANRWSAPGIGSEVGPSADNQRLFFQGLYLAPHIVAEAIKGSIFTARFFEKLGYEVLPMFNEQRYDLVQLIKLGSQEKVLAFCRGLQAASPVDSYVRPEAQPMPGYGDPVVMAAGTFVQGASLELSADGPLREPYNVYVQGGLSKEYVKLAIISAAREIMKTVLPDR